eukprot:m.325698 g.325698  ORF g.325698 m.325698 type:complete len:149 (-) comp55564_c2_seq14:1610-2056(-)
MSRFATLPSCEDRVRELEEENRLLRAEIERLAPIAKKVAIREVLRNYTGLKRHFDEDIENNEELEVGKGAGNDAAHAACLSLFKNVQGFLADWIYYMPEGSKERKSAICEDIGRVYKKIGVPVFSLVVDRAGKYAPRVANLSRKKQRV